jgi:hypothetical protein
MKTRSRGIRSSDFSKKKKKKKKKKEKKRKKKKEKKYFAKRNAEHSLDINRAGIKYNSNNKKQRY